MDPDTSLLAIITALRASISEYSHNSKAHEYIEGIEAKLNGILRQSLSNSDHDSNSEIRPGTTTIIKPDNVHTIMKSVKKRPVPVPTFDNYHPSIPHLTFSDHTLGNSTDSSFLSSVTNFPVLPYSTKKSRVITDPPSTTTKNTEPLLNDVDIYDIDGIAKSLLSVSTIETQIITTDPYYQSVLPVLLTSIPTSILSTVLLSMHERLRLKSKGSIVTSITRNTSVALNNRNKLSARASGTYPVVKRSLSPVVLSHNNKPKPLRSGNKLLQSFTTTVNDRTSKFPIVRASCSIVSSMKPVRTNNDGTLPRLETIDRSSSLSSPVLLLPTRTPVNTPVPLATTKSQPLSKKVTFSNSVKPLSKATETDKEKQPLQFLNTPNVAQVNESLNSGTTTLVASSTIPSLYATIKQEPKKDSPTNAETDLVEWEENNNTNPLPNSNTGLPIQPRVRMYGSKGVADYVGLTVGQQIFSSSY